MEKSRLWWKPATVLPTVLPVLALWGVVSVSAAEESVHALIEQGYTALETRNLYPEAAANERFLLALEKAGRSRSKRDEAAARVALGRQRTRVGDVVGALAYLEIAQELYQRLEDTDGRAAVQSAIGEVFRKRELIPRALEAFELSLALRHPGGAGASREAVETREILAEALVFEGSYDQALPHFEAAYEAWQGLGESQRAWEAGLKAGEAYYRVGRYRKAVEILRDTIEVMQGAVDLRIPVNPEAIKEIFEAWYFPKLDWANRVDGLINGPSMGSTNPFAWNRDSEVPTSKDRAYMDRRIEVVRKHPELLADRPWTKSASRRPNRISSASDFQQRLATDCAKLHRLYPELEADFRELLDEQADRRPRCGSSALGEPLAECQRPELSQNRLLNWPEQMGWPSECGPLGAGFDPNAVATPSRTPTRQPRRRRGNDSGELPDWVLKSRASEGHQKLTETTLFFLIFRPQTTPMSEFFGPIERVFEKHPSLREMICQQTLEVRSWNALGHAWAQLGKGYQAEAEGAYGAAWDANEAFLEALKVFGLTAEHLRDLRNAKLPAISFESCIERPDIPITIIHKPRFSVSQGQVSLSRDQLAMASAFFTQAAGGNEDLMFHGLDSAVEIRVAALAGAAEVRTRLGLPALAILNYQEATFLAESVQGMLREEQLASSFAGEQSPLYGRMIDRWVDLGEGRLAFEVAEQARARSFLNLIGNRRLDLRGLSPELTSEWNTLRRELVMMHNQEAELRSTTFGFGLAQPPDPQVAGRRIWVEERLESLRGKIRRQHPEAASFVSIQPLSAETVRAAMEGDTTLLVYFMTPTRSLAWVIEKQSVELVELPIEPSALSEKVERARLSIASKETAPAVLEELHAALLAPLIPKMTNQSLLIVPHGSLHQLPFAALRTPEGRYLVEDYSLSTMPSASALPYVQQHRNPWGTRLLAMGNSDGSLPHAEGEVRRIAELYGSESHSGAAAAEPLVHDSAGQIDVLHLAVHGHFSQERPLFSHVALAADERGPSHDPHNDGRLEVLEVANELDLAGINLVVLSACNSNVGSRSRGDDVVSMPRAFLYAGAPSVVTSFWAIDDTVSAELMVHFHQVLQTTDSGVAEALRQAQIKLIDRAPYFWAGFTLTGDPLGRGKPPARLAQSAWPAID